MRLFPLFPLALLATPVGAAQLHVRNNDAGSMREVSSMVCDLELTFEEDQQNHRGNYTTEFQGVTWGALLEGMTEECVDAPRNYCDSTALRREDPTCARPNGAVRGSGALGVTKPTVPLTAVARGAKGPSGYKSITYHLDHWNYVKYPPPNQQPGKALISAFGCGEYGDGPIAMVFDKPRTGLCLDLVFHKEPGDPQTRECSPGNRYHVEFWGEDGSHVGHQDVVEGGEPMLTWEGGNVNHCYQTFCWESDVPVAAVTTWPENGPGVYWESVCLGEAGSVPPAPPDPLQECLDQCAETFPAP